MPYHKTNAGQSGGPSGVPRLLRSGDNFLRPDEESTSTRTAYQDIKTTGAVPLAMPLEDQHDINTLERGTE